MNWLDVILLALLAMSAFAGARVGIIWTAMAFGSVLAGWYFAGNVSSAAVFAVSAYTDSTTIPAVVNALTYVALLALALYIATRALRLLKPLLAAVTLGLSSMLDRLGGLLLGLIVGLLFVGAIVLVAARITYQVDLSAVDLDTPGAVEGRIQAGETVLGGLEDLLASSTVVSAMVRVATALPANTLGLAPPDFGEALEVLDQALD